LDQHDVSLDLSWMGDPGENIQLTPLMLSELMADVLKNMHSVVDRVEGLAQRTALLNRVKNP